MTHQRALDLRSAKTMPGNVEDIIDAADDPKITVFIASRAVAGEIVAFVFAPVLFLIALLVAVNRAQHRRPRTSDN